MNLLLAQQAEMPDLLSSPLAWGFVLAAAGLWVMMASPRRATRRLGEVVGAVGLVTMAFGLPRIEPISEQVLFWLMAGMTVGSAAVAVSARNPVYTAIWFALSLVGVAGLFLLQRAQFLGVATIVVYAGAILVTFLFVLMLAQPDGQAAYDRISWSKFAPPIAVLASMLLAGVIAFSSGQPPASQQVRGNVLTNEHMAVLGRELFSRHMIAVEIAGTLLLVALVGAIAIVIHGRQRAVGQAAPAEETSR